MAEQKVKDLVSPLDDILEAAATYTGAMSCGVAILLGTSTAERHDRTKAGFQLVLGLTERVLGSRSGVSGRPMELLHHIAYAKIRTSMEGADR
jgi:hypothetical protein